MSRVIDRVQKIAEYIMAALLCTMMVLLFLNVVGRYFFRSGITVADEISRLSFVWLIFIGSAIAVRERSHMGIDMLVRRMSPLGKRLALIFTNGLILYALWLFAAGSWTQTLIGMRTVSPITGLPVATFAAAGLVSAVVMGLLYAIDLFRAITGKLREEELVQVQESPDLEEAKGHIRDINQSDKRQ